MAVECTTFAFINLTRSKVAHSPFIYTTTSSSKAPRALALLAAIMISHKFEFVAFAVAFFWPPNLHSLSFCLWKRQPLRFISSLIASYGDLVCVKRVHQACVGHTATALSIYAIEWTFNRSCNDNVTPQELVACIRETAILVLRSTSSATLSVSPWSILSISLHNYIESMFSFLSTFL